MNELIKIGMKKKKKKTKQVEIMNKQIDQEKEYEKRNYLGLAVRA